MQNPKHNSILRIEDITTLFVITDDSMPRRTAGAGRPSALSDSEVMTILLWCTLLIRQMNIKDIYYFVRRYHGQDFPCLPDYSSFVRHCHRLTPVMLRALREGLAGDAPLRFADSTMVEVCRLVRAGSHRTACGIAAFGKNHQGWHYGFKLHASVAPDGRFCGIALTPANIHDAQALPVLSEGARIIVGDTSYGASVMGRRLWEEQGVIVIAPPHPKQRKKLMTEWQHLLLKARPKIESVFDYLKNHLHLVTSFPRSVAGYLFHYLKVLLAYQLMVTLK